MNELAYVAVGSNLGDRAATIAAAIAEIDAAGDTRVVARSRLFETEPVGPPGQGRYLNGAIALSTVRSPRQLLELLLAIERHHGRTRDPAQRNAARTLDLDLLLYGDRRVDEPDLTIPHPRMHERLFVLEPLATIAADVRHPVLGATVGEMVARLRGLEAKS